LNGYPVIFVTFADEIRNGKPIPVVTGFLAADPVHRQPIGVALDRTGALVVADDVRNAAWRASSVATVKSTQ